MALMAATTNARSGCVRKITLFITNNKPKHTHTTTHTALTYDSNSRRRLALDFLAESEHHRPPDSHPRVDEPVAHLRPGHPATLRQHQLVGILRVRLIEVLEEPVAEGLRLDALRVESEKKENTYPSF